MDEEKEENTFMLLLLLLFPRTSGEAQVNDGACQFQGEVYSTSKMFAKKYKMFQPM